MNRLLAIVAFFACAPALAAENDWLIVPGQRIAQISIGMEHAEVLRLLGVPHRQDDLESLADDAQKKQFQGMLRDDWISPLPISAEPENGDGVFMVNFVTVYLQDRRVVQIEIRFPRFKTKDGLSSASTGIEWRKYFPHYKSVLQTFHHTSAGGIPATKHFLSLEDAVDAGIAWRNGVMGNLSPDTNPKEKVETVAVHAPGTPMIVDPDGGSRFIWKDDPRRPSSEH